MTLPAKMHPYFAQRNYGKSRIIDSLCKAHGEVLKVGNRIFVGVHKVPLEMQAEGAGIYAAGHQPAGVAPEAQGSEA